MFGKFIDVVQVWQAPSGSVIKVNGIILSVSGKPISDPSEIPKEGPIVIEYTEFNLLDTFPVRTERVILYAHA